MEILSQLLLFLIIKVYIAKKCVHSMDFGDFRSFRIRDTVNFDMAISLTEFWYIFSVIESTNPTLEFNIQIILYDPAPSSVYESLVNVENIEDEILNKCEDEGDSDWRMLYVSWTVNYPTDGPDKFEGIWILNSGSSCQNCCQKWSVLPSEKWRFPWKLTYIIRKPTYSRQKSDSNWSFYDLAL